MTNELDFETYLCLSSQTFEIYLLDKKNFKNLYFKKKSLKSENTISDLNILEEFLDENIFKIEKLIGRFIKNITLIIENENVLTFNIGIKKKNYEKIITKNFLENSLLELKDLFNKNYQDYKIMHMHIIKYIIDETQYSEFQINRNCENLRIEIQFISVPNKFIFKIDKVLEKYQIKSINCMNQNYLKSLFKPQKIEISQMAYRSKLGYNTNEVLIIPKNVKKTGFFERFFQLFS